MKTLTKRKPGAGKARRREDDGARPPAAAIRDGSGAWSAGVWSETHAALLGRIAGLMPQVDELMADLTARLLGDPALPGATILRGLADDEQRINLLRALTTAGRNAAPRNATDEAITAYASARRRWRAYVHGLWYTHENGRTFLAAPGAANAATFLVAREVTTAGLEAELARLTELGATLPRLLRSPAKAGTPVAKPGGALQKQRSPEAARAGRKAPKGEAATPRQHARGTRASDFAV